MNHISINILTLYAHIDN